MYFIPRTNRLYSWAVHTKPWQRYFITAAFISSIGASWWYADSWLQMLIQQKQQELSDFHKQCIQCAHAEHDCCQLQTDIPVLQKTLQSYVSAENVNTSLQAQTMYLLEQARNSGLLLNGYSAEKEIEKDWYAKGMARFDVRGTYDQLMKFLTTLANDQHMIQCNELHFTRDEQERLRITCQMKCMVITHA